MSRDLYDELWGERRTPPPPDDVPRHADYEAPQYDPIRRGGRNWRRILGRIWAPIAALLGIAVKFGAFSIKFFGIFISIGGYALLWGWQFGVGIVLLILVHEMGHFLEARRQGLHPSLPVFVPFLGAYVAIRDQPFIPWRNALVALAGPFLGGVGATGVWLYGEQSGSRMLQAIGYAGFLLNLVNLVPVGIFDGGVTARAWRALRQRADPRSWLVAGLYLAIAGALALGMYAAHVEQHRL